MSDKTLGQQQSVTVAQCNFRYGVCSSAVSCVFVCCTWGGQQNVVYIYPVFHLCAGRGNMTGAPWTHVSDTHKNNVCVSSRTLIQVQV